MKVIEFKFESMPDSAQYCSDTVIYAFEENKYICHILTVCELTAMSEKCIFISGKIECKEVNHKLQISACQRIIENQE